MYKDIVILTKSSKHGKYCVAGIDFETGNWIRLVSNDKDSDGALSEKDMLINDGICKPLDLVRVEILKSVPKGCQTENHLIVSGKRWIKLDTLSLDEVLELHKPKESSNIFGNTMPYISGIDRMSHSLFLAEVTNLEIHQYEYDGRTKTRASFVYNNRNYVDMRVTDPDYYSLPDCVFDRAYIVFSIPNQDFDGKYYKFMAKIFPRKKYFDFHKAQSLEEILDVFDLPIPVKKCGWDGDYYYKIKNVILKQVTGTNYKNDNFYSFKNYNIDDPGLFYVCLDKAPPKYKIQYDVPKPVEESRKFTEDDVEKFYDKLYGAGDESNKKTAEKFRSQLVTSAKQETVKKDNLVYKSIIEEQKKNQKKNESLNDKETSSEKQLERKLKLKPSKSIVYIFEEGYWKNVKYRKFVKKASFTYMIVEGAIFSAYDYPNAIVALSESEKKANEINARRLDYINREKISAQKELKNK